MTEPTDTTVSSPLDPTAPTFTMTAEQSKSQNATSDPKSQPNGQATSGKQKASSKPNSKPASTEADAAEAGAGVKLTGAQLKKQKAAEKAARRAEKLADRGAVNAPQEPESSTQRSSQRRMSTNKKEGPAQGQSRDQGGRGLPIARPVAGTREQAQAQAQDKKLDKRVPMLSHLYPSKSSERASVASAGREIHPAVLALGLQFRDYVICGSNARTVATLLVFKKVIQSYSTPAGIALSRHLTTHLSHQISYLSHARPLNVAQGNSIRWLKKLISALDPDLAESEAKSFICKAIDGFVGEKITLADEVIATQAGERIEKTGEVILTYGKSSVVEKTFLTAWREGKRFRVVVVDSRPLFEGKNLARSLIRAGLEDVRYCLLSGLADVIAREGVTKCFLGASAMLGNGRLSSRAGTAMVAMMAKEGGAKPSHGRRTVPVIVLCESVKFTAKVALDSLIMNEVADADALVEQEDPKALTAVQPQAQQKQQTSKSESSTSKKGGKPNEEPEEKKQNKGLQGWKDQPNLYLLNLMYDVTPAQFLDVVISELGSLPPGAVPVVNGVHGDDE